MTVRTSHRKIRTKNTSHYALLTLSRYVPAKSRPIRSVQVRTADTTPQIEKGHTSWHTQDRPSTIR